MVLAQDLRAAVLQAAMQGKLTEQLPEDGDARDLLAQIKVEKEQLEKEKKIKKERKVNPITEILFVIPENWVWVRLPEILLIQPSNGKSVTPVEYDTGVKNLTLTATTSGVFKPEEYKYVNLEIDVASRYWLHPGDLLIQRSNSRELVGTSCIYDGKDEEYIYPDLMMRMRVMEPINLQYIDYVLKSPYVRTYYSNNAIGTSESMPKINQSIVGNTMIPIPPLAEQHRIVARVEEFMAKIDEYEKMENELAEIKAKFPGEMKAAILRAAMDGQLMERSNDDWGEKELSKVASLLHSGWVEQQTKCIHNS